MTDYKLTEEDRKRLTEFLGECSKPDCVGCEKDHTNCDNWKKYLRTFTTPSDQHAVFTKLVDTKRWERFITDIWLEYPVRVDEGWFGFIAWLWINQERFCKLVSDYLKEEGK